MEVLTSMIIGAMNVTRVQEKSYCRIAEDYYLSNPNDFKIHSTTLMPNIPFGLAQEIARPIDSSIFLNDMSDEYSKLEFSEDIKIQNYLTTHFVGRCPYNFYGPITKMGEQFELWCENGIPDYEFRKFGTQSALAGNNTSSNNMVVYSQQSGL